MGLLVACKNEEDHIKNEGARVVTTLFINFSDAQGQLTPKSVMESYRNSNPSMLLWLVLLSARMKKIHSKMKVLEWSQDFPHYNPMGAICCHGNQSSDQILPKTSCSQSPTPMMLLMKFDYDWPAGFRDIHV